MYNEKGNLLKSTKKVPNLKKCQTYFLVPNEFKKCQISGIWHQKCQYGHPVHSPRVMCKKAEDFPGVRVGR